MKDEIKSNSVNGITYCQADTTKKGNFKDKVRKDFRKINDVSDIDGARTQKRNSHLKININTS